MQHKSRDTIPARSVFSPAAHSQRHAAISKPSLQRAPDQTQYNHSHINNETENTPVSIPAENNIDQTEKTDIKPFRLKQTAQPTGPMPIMRKLGFEYEIGGITPKKNSNWTSLFAPTWKQMTKGEIIQDKGDYQITADLGNNGSNNLEFITRPFDENDITEGVAVKTTANSIKDDITEITNKPLKMDHPLKTFNRISGSSALYIEPKETDPKGQIQMTGGVSLDKLPGLLSGDTLGAIPQGSISVKDTPRILPLQKYFKIGLDGPAMGLVYGHALKEVKTSFDNVSKAGQEIIAAAAALMAQLIIEHRQQPFDDAGRLANAGRFMAKTDYAMILQLIEEKSQDNDDNINWSKFPDVVLATALPLVDKKAMMEHEKVAHLSLGSPVFPVYHKLKGDSGETINFPDLKIGQWIRAALPQGRKKEKEEIYESHGYSGVFYQRETGRMVPVGKDLLTKANYPGSLGQGKKLSAYGAYGSKTDPGEKVILEWRDLTSIRRDLLPKVMSALFKYYSR